MVEATLAGRSILLVEDEYFLADELSRALRDVGATVLGPVPSVQGALDLLEKTAPDAAVLDVNLSGEGVLPVADALAGRHVPFLFTTGYDQAAISERHATVRCFGKPIEAFIVLRELRRLLDPA